VDIKHTPSSAWTSVFGSLITFLLFIVFGAILIFMLRQSQGANSQAMRFGKSTARMFTGNKPTVTFQAVAGVDEALIFDS